MVNSGELENGSLTDCHHSGSSRPREESESLCQGLASLSREEREEPICKVAGGWCREHSCSKRLGPDSTPIPQARFSFQLPLPLPPLTAKAALVTFDPTTMASSDLAISVYDLADFLGHLSFSLPPCCPGIYLMG